MKPKKARVIKREGIIFEDEISYRIYKLSTKYCAKTFGNNYGNSHVCCYSAGYRAALKDLKRKSKRGSK